MLARPALDEPQDHSLVKIDRVAFPHNHPSGPTLAYFGTIRQSLDWGSTWLYISSKGWLSAVSSSGLPAFAGRAYAFIVFSLAAPRGRRWPIDTLNARLDTV